MNWGRGFKRLAYFGLGLIWFGFAAIHWIDKSGPAEIGESLVYMLFFTLAYMLFFAAVAWVARGFFDNRQEERREPRVTRQ